MKNLLFALIILTAVACGGDKNASVDTAATPTATTQPARTTQAPRTAQPAKAAQQKAPVRAQPQQIDLGDYKAKNEGWHVILEDAYAESKKTGKPIMANFTGSDWCGWCKRLDKSVFHQPGFAKWADENVVLLELDFPRRFKVPEAIAQQNRGLQQSFQVRGYPSIWLFDLDKDDTGKFNISALGKTGYTKTLGEFQTTMEKYIAGRS